jgi:hypothetical protein
MRKRRCTEAACLDRLRHVAALQDAAGAVRDPAAMCRRRSVLLVALLLCACVRHDAPVASARLGTCAPQLQTRLYFGLDTPDGPVADAGWQAFIDEIVTPRFGDGLTVLEARGQWRDAHSGATTREPSRVVEIVHADAPAQQHSLAEIAAHYKRRFRQQAVLMTQAPVRACL